MEKINSIDLKPLGFTRSVEDCCIELGGTHLGPATVDQQLKTIDYLRGLNLECLAPNHCTGLGMLSKLAVEFPSAFRWAMAGNRLDFF